MPTQLKYWGSRWDAGEIGGGDERSWTDLIINSGRGRSTQTGFPGAPPKTPKNKTTHKNNQQRLVDALTSYQRHLKIMNIKCRQGDAASTEL